MKGHASAHPHEKPHHPHWPLAAILFAFVFALGMASVHDPSTWIRIRVGAKILADGALPRVEPFSYGAGGAAWTTHSWLTDVLFARLDALGGPGLLVAFKSAAIALAFALLLPISHGSPLIAASLLSAGACAAWSGFSETPFVFDLLFFAVFVRLLRPRHRFRGLDAAVGVGLTALWANLHGAGAILALWLVGLKVFKTSLRTAARERLGYWTMFVACLIAFSWNPHGYAVLAHSFADAGHGSGDWRSSLLSPAGAFILAGGISCWFTLQQEFVTTLAAAAVVAMSVVLPGLRPLAVLASCPTIALALGHAVRPRADTWPRVLRWSAFPALLFAGYYAAVTRPLASSGGYGVPTLAGALHYLNASGVRGRMFNEPEIGAELIGLGDRPVFCDRRQALYPESFRRDAADWARRFPALDAVYRFDYAIVRNRRARAAARILDESRDWRLAYADDRALVYLKTSGADAWLAPQSVFWRLTPNRLWPDVLDAALADPKAVPGIMHELDRWAISAPDCVQALLWKAHALHRLKMGDQADRLVELALGRTGEDPELRALGAYLLEERGRREAARSAYRDAGRAARLLGDAPLSAAIEARLAGLAAALSAR